jgi:heterodisulfide reductase subunit B
VTQLDNPLAPTIFENLLAAAGARPVDWPLRLDCCGHPAWEKNIRLSLALMQHKLADAREAGARVMATACTYCQIQFDIVRASRDTPPNAAEGLPSILVTQLVGFAIGLPESDLELAHNRLAPVLA